MGLSRTAIVVQGTENIRNLHASRGHDIVSSGNEAGYTRIAVGPKQVEVVCGDNAKIFYFGRDARLVASDHTILKTDGTVAQEEVEAVAVPYAAASVGCIT